MQFGNLEVEPLEKEIDRANFLPTDRAAFLDSVLHPFLDRREKQIAERTSLVLENGLK